MKLEDIAPREVNFTVSGVGLTFRPFTIGDDLAGREFCDGPEGVFKAFKESDFERISLIAWYQLTLESQKTVMSAVAATRINPETGAEEPVSITPLEKFRHLFQGLGDQIALIADLMRCKGINVPDLGDEDALKKWVGQFAIPTGP